MLPLDIETLGDTGDDALILAASWEERCLGLSRRLHGYRARRVLITEYDGPSARRTFHLAELRDRLSSAGRVDVLGAKHGNPLENVRKTVDAVSALRSDRPVQLSIDISTFTRRHLLQLLHGLDTAGYLASCKFYHTEPLDYDTRDDDPMSLGLGDVRAVETLVGENRPSRDVLLVIFLGYEGRRTAALWEHLDPNITIAVVADPPYREGWRERSEAINHYLLSCIPPERVLRAAALVPAESEDLLRRLVQSSEFSGERYNYRVAPAGPKPQLIGAYRYWRLAPGRVTFMYASPARYREDHSVFGPGPTWLVDETTGWPAMAT